MFLLVRARDNISIYRDMREFSYDETRTVVRCRRRFLGILSHYKPKKWDKKWDKGVQKCQNGAKMQVFLSKMPVFGVA